MNNSFILFTDFWPGMQLLSREQRGDLLQALMAEYGAEGCQQPNLDVPTQIVLAMMRPRMEDNRKKWEAEVQRRKDAAAKGGAAKAAKANAIKHQSAEATASRPEATEATGSMPEHAVAGDSLPKHAEATGSMPEQVFLPVYDPDYDHDHDYDDLSKRSISSKTDAPPLSSADASDERAPMPGTSVHDDQEDTDPGVLQMQFPAPHPAQPSPIDDCPLCREQAAPPPPPARKKTKVNLRAEEFDAWYELYPRHESKAKAAEAWDKLVKAGKLPSLDVLTAALTWQREQWDDPKYIPLPASYLRAEKWADEPRRQHPSAQRASPYFPRMSPPIEAHQDFSLPTDARGVVPKQILANL